MKPIHQVPTMLVLACLFLLAFQSSTSDTNCEDKLAHLRELLQKKEFNTAKIVAPETLDCIESQLPIDRVAWIENQYLYGNIYRSPLVKDSFAAPIRLAYEWSQKALADTSLLSIKCLLEVGVLAYINKDFPRTRMIFDQVDSLYRLTKNKDFDLSFDFIRDNARYYKAIGDFDKALDIFNTGLDLCKKENSPKGDEKIGIIYNNMGVVESKRGNFLACLEYYKKNLAVFRKIHDDSHTDAERIYYNLGNVYLKIGNDLQAKKYYEKGYEAFLINHSKDDPNAAQYLQNIGYLTVGTGDVEKGIEYVEEALRIVEKTYGGENDWMIKAQSRLASVYLSSELPRKTITLLDKTIASIKANPTLIDPSLVIICYSSLAIAYSEIGQYEKAINYNHLALKKLEQYGSTDQKVLELGILRIMGELYIDQEDYSRAIFWIKKAIQLSETNMGLNSPKTAHLYSQLAKTIFYSDNKTDALVLINTSLDRFGFDIKEAIHFAQFEAGINLLDALHLKLKLEWNTYEENATVQNLDTLILFAEKAIDLLDYQRQNLGNENAKEFLTDWNFYLYESIIKAYLLKYEVTQDQVNLVAAANYVERSKSNILLDAVRQPRISKFAGVPEETIQVGNDLRTNIGYIEQRIYQSTEGSEQQKDDQNRLFDLKRSYRDYKKTIAERHPDFFTLLHQKDWKITTDIRDQLDDDTVLLEFFMGDNIIVIFGIARGENFHWWQKIPKDFKENLNDFLVELSTPPAIHKIDINSQRDSFIHKAEEIYTHIFQPIQDILPKETKNLIIIPDGLLSYLPFELLVETDSENYSSFKELPYLLNRYNFSYAPSISVWDEMRKKEVASKGILVVAPSFKPQDTIWTSIAEARRNNLNPLAFNKAEGEAIQKISKGIGLFGQEATLANFHKQYHQADILHLATHAKVEEAQNRYSYLAFADQEGSAKNNRLYLANLYNMKLPANMVVLSACETGLGKLQRGEGIMSLARGFTYAGAKSIITSLWAVNDMATAELMEGFYRRLKDGLSKDQALRYSKLAFLAAQKNELNSHPYYWAAFVAIGDMKRVDISKGFHLGWILGVGFVLLLGCNYLRILYVVHGIKN